MSERILKLLSEEIALQTTGTTMGNAQLVRVKNSSATTAYAIIVKDSGTTTGSMTLFAGEVAYIRKKAAETIESTATNTDVKIIVVGFGD